MKISTISVKLGRKKTRPVNIAAKSLKNALFRPKVQANPKAYSRKVKHRAEQLTPRRDEE